MKKMIRTAAVAAAFTVAGVGLAGVAGAAEDTNYVPPACTQTVNGVETAVDCTAPEVESARQDPTPQGELGAEPPAQDPVLDADHHEPGDEHEEGELDE